MICAISPQRAPIRMEIDFAKIGLILPLLGYDWILGSKLRRIADALVMADMFCIFCVGYHRV